MREVAKKINEAIKDCDTYKRYLLLKDQVENDAFLCTLKEQMKELKNDICKNRNEDKVNLYYELEKEYNRNILIVEYSNIKKELRELFEDIVDILSLN